MELLTSQRSALFEWVAAAAYDVREFSLDEDEHGWPTIRHLPSAYWFRIELAKEGFTVYYSPGADRPEGNYGRGGWERIVPDQFGHWLSYLRRELDATDPWSQLEVQRAALGGDLGGIENTPFTAEELLAVEAQLAETRAYLLGLNLPPEKLAAVQARLNYIESAAQRGMGRIDWRNAFVGVMLTLLVESLAPPETVRTILAMTIRGLAHLFGLDLPELPPP